MTSLFISNFDMKAIILKLIFVIWICLSLIIIIGSNNRNIGSRFLVDEKGTGDLYKFSKLSFFDEKLNHIKYIETTKPEVAEIITIGDSFFQTTTFADTYANLLEKKLNIKVSNIFKKSKRICKPKKLLEENNYNRFEKKILIFETIERGAYFYGLNYYLEEKNVINLTEFQKKKELIFGDKRMRFFFVNNIFLYHINKLVKNLRFSILKELVFSIGKFSIEHKMLFHNDGTDFYESEKKEKVMNNSIDFVKNLKTYLKEKYNIEMVFMIIPDKYTIYKDYVTDSIEYDEFIPKFQKKLDVAGIRYIDIYSKYIEYRKEDDSELLYFRSDTHYTPLGKQIAVDETVKFLSENKLLEEIDE